MEIDSIKNSRIFLSQPIAIYFFLILILNVHSFAQISELRFESFAIKDNFPAYNCEAILQDHLGFMWFGTTYGLVQYDGYTLQTFKINYENDGIHINSLAEDKNGDIWLGGSNGLHRFSRSYKGFKSYQYKNDGYPSNGIYYLYIDKKGNIWFITYDSKLIRFDPVTQTFRYFDNKNFDEDRKTTIAPYYVFRNKAFIEDSEGNIWCGLSDKGLYRYNYSKDKLIKYPVTTASDGISSNKISHILQDSRGLIWIATIGGGVNCFDKKTQTFSHFKNEPGNINSISNDIVVFIHEDKGKNIWFSNIGGLDVYKPEQHKFIHLNPGQQDASQHFIFRIHSDNNDNLWFVRYDNKIIFYDTRRNNFTTYNINLEILKDSEQLTEIWNTYLDKFNNMWFGFWNAGVVKLNLSKQGFTQPTRINEYSEELTFNKKIVTCQDSFGNIFIGTYGKGLLIFSSEGKLIKSFRHNPRNINSLSSDTITSISMGGDNIVWVGAIGPVLNKVDLSNSVINHYSLLNSRELSGGKFPKDGIDHIYEDHNSKVWIGTRYGLFEFDKKLKGKSLVQIDSNMHLYNSGYFIFEDTDSKLWLGSDGQGLIEFDKDNRNLIRYLGDETISSIVSDKFGKLWIGTYTNGIIEFDPKSKIYKYFTIKDGLSSNMILDQVVDDKGIIWISTKNGITKLNPARKLFKIYNESDALNPNGFLISTGLKGKDGKIYFGTKYGIISFHPNDIIDDKIPPDVVITNISLLSRPDENISPYQNIRAIKEMELDHNQNDLLIEYVGLHYGYPEKNEFKYKLKNFDEHWIFAGFQRKATYTNLDPGEYVFKVIASNSDGVWNEEGASIKIIILPPWWQTTWAYAFYILLISSIIYAIWKGQLKRIRVKHEYEMSRFEAQKLHEVDELKSRFFANISHEFRTPLTLILGPVKQIIGRTKETKTKEDLNLVHRNANRLLGLVNQLLDISKIESGNMKLQTIPINIIPYLKALVLSFTSYAERKKISLKFISDLDELTVYIDKDKFEKIINNVLSNAFKFTPDGGTIEVSVNQDYENLKIIISDTGVGIPKEKLRKIFDRFYQVDGSHTREQEGTGIGLSLTKELVELHKGSIEVESEEGKGSTFTVSIKLGTAHLKPEEICELESEEIESYQSENTYVISPENKINSVDTDAIMQKDKPLLLIVEDNYDVRNYIKDNLNSVYRIIVAVDGEDGWNKSVNNFPDLIVSDVMMPKMDGFELCKRLKIDERTSHIPIILLTAKAAKQDKIEGYELGADEYLMKPFEPDELRVRIKNLIEQRKKLHEHFKKKGILEVEETKITSVDKKFLQNAFELINQNISETTFGVEALAELLNVSRSVLHRKIASLTGESPGDLIRRIRLTKASHLIEQNFGNISEIAIEVGFSNPAQFSKSFQKQFGITPSAYQQKNTNS